jgi:peptidoglycan/xylan/chitin deacetylase (PgdA/CDA1 family)
VGRWSLVIAALCAAGGASAKGWQTPAAGESASGDIEVLFTFDDGPNPVTTPQVLDILAAHEIRAVFFMVGEMAGSENKKVPPIVERVLRDGHVIANHTMTHRDLCRSDERKAIADLDDGKATIERVAGIPIAWFRAPYGVRCDRLDAMLGERGLTHFHWDLDPQEWKHGDVDKTVKYVTGALARAHGRVVLLLHDIKPVTVKALPQILGWIDAENARRARSHKRKIRVLSAPALAVERLPAGLVGWLDDATAELRALPRSIARALP